MSILKSTLILLGILLPTSFLFNKWSGKTTKVDQFERSNKTVPVNLDEMLCIERCKESTKEWLYDCWGRCTANRLQSNPSQNGRHNGTHKLPVLSTTESFEQPTGSADPLSPNPIVDSANRAEQTTNSGAVNRTSEFPIANQNLHS